ncbi:aldose epimerase family protein [Breznakia pachnodae]|uniref:Aldose 1-epimerase n=1 Tax=Breznakia pachnodae TaxID=265178 RepID=A0ABU0E482_9FIRM|nr:aldose epimerase [Breznakia pachnodae]MDQ0361713.1 aldose 1-epimerase [Breznakia pachnodae]
MKSEELYNYQGNPVYEYTMRNDELEIRALNYGASVTMIQAKNKNGVKENVVVAYDDIESYFTQPGPYLNAMVGPTAGRIAYGKYMLDGKEHTLSLNSPPNHLHGGATGISKQFFHAEELKDGDKQILRFTLDVDHSKDGYSGTYTYQIDYILEGNTFTIKSLCAPQNKGIANLTSHMYFNLSGDLKDSINGHELKIPSSKKTKVDKDNYPGAIVDIDKNSAFDFLNYKTILQNFAKGDEEFEITRGYDTAFLLNEGNTITLHDKESGRLMNVTTDQKSVVVYSANYFDSQLIINENKKGYPFCSIALETQDIPNGINIVGDEGRVFDTQHPYKQITTYEFSIK